MKIYVKIGDNYLLIDDEKDISNIKNDILKEETINQAMNILETKKLNMEIAKQKNNNYRVLKLGTHPMMKSN